VATLIGCGLAWIGLKVPQLKPLYDYGWFVGFGASAVIHYVLMKTIPPQSEVTVEAGAMQRG
jgi:cytosine/uracil/thiamine/allantoin permease